MKGNPEIYAVYKGEDFLTEGTAKECAKFLNVKVTTIYFYNSKTYKNRIQGKRKNGKERKAILAISLGELIEKNDDI